MLPTVFKTVSELGYSGFSVKNIHHRGAEFAEIGEFINQELFTPRPPRLGGAISESCFRAKPEDPQGKATL
jgi:hypothetical protein